MARPNPQPSLPPRRSTSLTASIAGTIRRPFRTPRTSVSTDAGVVFGGDAPGSRGADGELEKGRNEIVSALFHVCSHVVTGLLACLSVVSPAFVILSVTPFP